MDISYVNNLLGQVKVKLESLHPDFNEDMEMQQADLSDSENDDARLGAAKKRLSNLLGKLSSNRSDSNRVKSYGTGR